LYETKTATTEAAMASDEHEILEQSPIERVEIDPSTLTPTSPEVISK
jgi:hypothetical protein